jgi:hypothetical protein
LKACQEIKYREVKEKIRLAGGERKTARPGSIHDTEEITYRCFLPDLTRFMAFCYEATGQNNPYRPAQPEVVYIIGLLYFFKSN